MKIIIIIIIILVTFILSSCSTMSNKTPDFDFTYQRLLKENNIGRLEWISKWINDYGAPVNKEEKKFESPVNELFIKWENDSIVSSVILEYPGFHAGEHLTSWLVRTKNNLYFHEFFYSDLKDKKVLDPKLYDEYISELYNWNNSIKLSEDDAGKHSIPGYAAILSVFYNGASKQIFLNIDDLTSDNPDKMWKRIIIWGLIDYEGLLDHFNKNPNKKLQLKPNL